MTGYLRLTRTHTYALLFALPLLLLYEGGALWIGRVDGSDFRNGADVMLRLVLAAGGIGGTATLTLSVIGVGAWLIVRERRRKRIPLRISPFAGMMIESLAYASVFGLVIGGLTRWVLEIGPWMLAAGGFANLTLREGIVLSLGAGLYEELVFRVLLVGGVYGALRGSGLGRGQAGLFGVAVPALIFSAFHYVGPYGDTLEIGSFIFRFLAGVAFSALFLVRGFGITAWTHALYDLLIVAAIWR